MSAGSRAAQRQLDADAERLRSEVGQALHDTVCQSLGGIAILAKLLARRAKAGKGIGPEELEELASMTGRALEEARALSRNLLPVQLETAGLMAALEELAAETSRSIRCSFVCETPVLVGDTRSALAVYRGAQESVRLALLQGDTAAIAIILSERNGEPLVQVRRDARASTPPAGTA